LTAQKDRLAGDKRNFFDEKNNNYYKDSPAENSTLVDENEFHTPKGKIRCSFPRYKGESSK